MSKTRTYRLLVAVAMVAFANFSCVNVEEFGYEAQSRTVGFQAVVKKHDNAPRAAIEGVNYPTTVNFGAFAMWLDEGQIWANDHAAATPFIDNNEVAYNTFLPATWTTETAYYWPDTGSLTCFAYSPYRDNSNNPLTNVSVSAATGALTINNWNLLDAKYKEIDLMLANVQTERTFANSSSGIPTIFNHLLSRIDVKAGLASEYKEEGGPTYKITLRKVALKQVYMTGDYTTQTNRWESPRNATTIWLYNNETEGTDGLELVFGTTTNAGETTFVLPQVHLEGAEGTQAELFVEWHDSKPGEGVQSATINLREKFTDSYWGQGKHYTYILAWDRGATSYIEFDPPTISSDWVSGGSHIITIE